MTALVWHKFASLIFVVAAIGRVRDESTRRHRCHPRARTGTATDGAIDHIADSASC
jgi:hypothetical protein